MWAKAKKRGENNEREEHLSFHLTANLNSKSPQAVRAADTDGTVQQRGLETQDLGRAAWEPPLTRQLALGEQMALPHLCLKLHTPPPPTKDWKL